MNDYHYPHLPVHIKESIDLWVSTGRKPGGFVTSCLEDSFYAVVRAHRSLTMDNLRDIYWYIHNEIPSLCHGSREKMKDWKMMKESEQEQDRQDTVNKLEEGL